jgi:hypothetical protein
MKIACLAVLAFALVSCADGPSPRQKYGSVFVTGSNVPQKDSADSMAGVAVYPRSALEKLQSGGSPGKDPMQPGP